MARKRKGRPVNGILLLDKPTGHSSNHVLQKVRRMFNAQKAGHTGSLDPLASGMLPICFGEATKFSQYLLDAHKAYRVTARLGEKTSTADAEGEVIETRPVNVTLSQLEEVIGSFLGHSMQVPSMYSALKHQGQPLYKLARQGIEVERKARPIEIMALQLESFTEQDFSMYVECSKGTYIRNLVEDIGEQLGCGAHVTVLRREWVAHFESDEMQSLDELQQLRDEEAFTDMDALLLPVDAALHGYPSVELDADSAFYFKQGQCVQAALPKESEVGQDGLIKIYDHQASFIGLATINDDLLLQPKRVISSLD
ncbi:tRNA pseudouridine(55) synthase TruB [Pleionea litopenaei]|uniref:tRNA pseudouridine synthase B n=1 Tax=Pleionea litopenaei TaxID=3070815 RepID=A0AA51RRX8_9GAMM|nr:tRNA pseudouridine(55) synthase TruB [Pleionea sp. HL-JVS1]WMS86532.1 tRNA pseudouridine(55) synthase TruB [Pleionea sp. HL-JVS1]